MPARARAAATARPPPAAPASRSRQPLPPAAPASDSRRRFPSAIPVGDSRRRQSGWREEAASGRSVRRDVSSPFKGEVGRGMGRRDGTRRDLVTPSTPRTV
jgi:hypothetical protein